MDTSKVDNNWRMSVSDNDTPPQYSEYIYVVTLVHTSNVFHVEFLKYTTFQAFYKSATLSRRQISTYTLNKPSV